MPFKDHSGWNMKKISVMRDVPTAKPESSDKFRSVLINSQDKILVEATCDKFWEAGLCPQLVMTTDIRKLRSSNHLGKLLMELRDKLHAQNATSAISPSLQSTSPALTMTTQSDTTTGAPVTPSTNSIPSTETATETHCTTPDATTIDTPLDMTIASSANVTSNELVRLRDHVKKPANLKIDLLKINASGKDILKRGRQLVKYKATELCSSVPSSMKSTPLTSNTQLISGFLINDNSPVKRKYVVSPSSTRDDNERLDMDSDASSVEMEVSSFHSCGASVTGLDAVSMTTDSIASTSTSIK